MVSVVLYIDPGTGSMLFSLVIAIATAAVFGMRTMVNRMKFLLSAGKTVNVSDDRIPYVIYSDHKRYLNIFKPICDEFEKREVGLVYYTQSKDDPIFDMKYEFIRPEFIGEGNKGIAKMNFLKAQNVISTTPGLDVFQWKRSRDVKRYIHIPHSLVSLGGYRTFGIDHYDSILTCSERQSADVVELECVRKLDKKRIVLVGCPFMDEGKKNLSKMNQYEGPNLGKITVLLAPSWGPSGLLTKYGETLISALVETGFHIIIRPHPESYIRECGIITNLKEKYKKAKNVEWNSDNDNLEVMNRADIMVSDFSGIVFDFAFLLGRPVIMADEEFDTIIYDYDWMNYDTWHYKELDDLGVWLTESNISNIKSIIIDLLTNDQKKGSRIEAKDKLWAYQGEASKRVVDYIMSCDN